MVNIERVGQTRALVGEGPIWDEREGVLWWTDIKGKAVHRFDTRSERETSFPLPIRVGSLALRERGGFVLAAEHGFWLWSPENNRLEHILDVEADRSDNRMNDGRCDPQGRFVAASMNLMRPDRQPTGACWRLDGALQAERLIDGLRVGNAIAFSPAGDNFYFADTPEKRVRSHAYGPNDPVVESRPFFDLAGLPGLPDGAVTDEEGYLWIAGVFGGQLYRVSPNGDLDRTVDLPVATPTCPCFGGDRLDDLYVTSLGEDLEAPAGHLFRIRGLGVRGLPTVRFRG